MQLEDFTYHLPESAIAIHPPTKRGSTRLLVLNRNDGAITDRNYADLAALVGPNDLLVLNNTKVIRARLQAVTESGDARELLLLEKHGPAAVDPHKVHAMYRRKLHLGQHLLVGETELLVAELFDDGTATITSDADILALAEARGSVPLPPYMHRQAEPSDIERYQTVFAKQAGSVAAPTASLNLTEELLQQITAKGAHIAEITLHVGLGTFMPIRVDDVTKHKMHEEYFEIPAVTAAAIRKTKAAGGRVIAIGTTVTRTLEYAAPQLAHTTSDISGEADIFIYPGYKFKVVDALLTNFHAPASTVLMMAAAFAGWEHLKTAYEQALKTDYKFLSYGDSMLIT